MSHSGNIVSLFVTLFICTLDGYSMMNYRVPAKRAYGYFCCRNGSLSGIQFLYHDSLWKYGASKCYFIHDRTAVFCVDIVDHQR